MNARTCRGAFSKRILERAKKDKDIVVVCTDSRGSASLGNYPSEVPNQFVEIGIAEQNAITVSAGMASVGKKVFEIGPASFNSMRSAEQVKVDVAYSHNNVKIIGISGGLSYGALGATHHSLQDVALMRSIPDIIVEIPSDAVQMESLVDEFLKNENPVYCRIGRGAVPDIYETGTEFKIGQAVKWFDGTDCAVITCGQMLWRALEAVKNLEKENIHCTVYDMHTVKPIDKKAIMEASKRCGKILTAEEASVYGGLGAAVCEFVSQNYPVPVKILGIPDGHIPNGSDDEVFKYFNMNVEGIEKSIRELSVK